MTSPDDEPADDPKLRADPPRPVLARGLVEAAAGQAAPSADDTDPGNGVGGGTHGSADASGAASESADTPPEGTSDPPPVAPGATDPAPTVDVADPDAEALSAIPLVTRVEAALFAASEPLPMKRLRELTGCPDPRPIRAAVDALAAEYAASGRAFRVEEVAQGFQLRTSETVAAVVARMGRRATDERLSAAALETLAVVAYRQPVLRVDVEKIRGVACGEVLRALQERGLVRVAGRADLPGSPLLYGTTQRFLEIFGLRDLQELPRDRELLRQRET